MREVVEDAPERPLLPPWIGRHGGGPALFYADAQGRTVIVPLAPLDLARLGLSIAEAQAELARRDLNDAVQGPRLQPVGVVAT